MRKLLVFLSLLLLAGCVATRETKEERAADLEKIARKIPSPETELPEEGMEPGLPESIWELPPVEPGEETGKKETLLAKKKVPPPSGVPGVPKTTEGILPGSQDFSIWRAECLIYEAKWNFATIGNALIACQEEQTRYGEVYHLVAITLPTGLMAKLGYGFNRVDSYVHKKTFQPYYFYSYTRNGKIERIVRTEFNQQKKAFTWLTRKYRSGQLYESRKGVVSHENPIYDSVAVFYLMRKFDLEKEKEFTLPVGITKIWQLLVRVKSKIIQEVPSFGKQELYVLEPEAKSDEGLFQEGRMTVWVSADSRRLPMYFFGRMALGTAKLSLMSVTKLADGTVFDQKTIANLLSALQNNGTKADL